MSITRRTLVRGLLSLLVGAGAWMPAAMAADPPAGATWKYEDFYSVRGGIANCRARFLNEQKGRVVFLGGSITTMPGWRALTCELLKNRFPDTQFDFMDAGIGGTNSSLGAFRFESDVFKNGPVDLLFLEFAVNDGAEETPDDRSARAMEGIIRHARRLNPRIDIIIQYFADTEKVADIRAGRVPKGIQRHDDVARHYDQPVVNMALAMTRRIDAGEFTWEEFSRDTCHPKDFGHARYMEHLTAFLDAAWAGPAPEGTALTEYAMPAPLDPKNYENGRFIELDHAKIVQGWTRLPQWDTEKKCNYGGAVDVLAAETAGAVLELPFEGTLIGISAIVGMDAGIVECSIDGGPFSAVDLFDGYCAQFHRPVCKVLAEDLAPGKHVLTLRMAEAANPASVGHAARILKFVSN